MFLHIYLITDVTFPHSSKCSLYICLDSQCLTDAYILNAEIELLFGSLFKGKLSLVLENFFVCEY